MNTQNQDQDQNQNQNAPEQKTTETQITVESQETAQSEKLSQDAQENQNPQENEKTEKEIQPEQTTVPAVKEQQVIVMPSKGNGLTIFALAVSLLALGASGALFYQGQMVLRDMESSWGTKLSEAGVVNNKTEQLAQESMKRVAALETQAKESDDRLNQYAKQYNTLNDMYQELTKTRFDWLMAETEYTLNFATQQLQLSGNVPAAISALENIESRLSKFDRPELIPVKQAVSKDLNNLKELPYLDVTGLTIKLDRLETELATLPMMLDTMLTPDKEKIEKNTVPSGLSWWESLWFETKESLKGLVQVQQTSNSDALLLSPEQVYFVKENIRLRILSARLALMQHQGLVYKNDLTTVEDTVKRYFDQNAPITKKWLEDLKELKAASFEQSANSLSASLQAVRAYQSSMEANDVSAKAPEATSASEVQDKKAGESAASEPENKIPMKPVQKGQEL